jgi:hypothetical protein
MQTYLSETQKMVRKGNYKEALERYIWFHEHVLEHDSAMKGVRLSFALSYWKNLAEVYPPAMEAMKEMRDKKTWQITVQGEPPGFVADVVAFNMTLGENSKSIELFQLIEQKYPSLAKESWRLLAGDLFNFKQYNIIQKYLDSPVSEYIRVESEYGEMLKDLGETKELSSDEKSFFKEYFVKKSLQLIDYSLAINDIKSAKKIQQKASTVTRDNRLFNAIPQDK